MLLRTHRWARRLAFAAAAMPMMQMTCDPAATILQTAAAVNGLIFTSITQLVISQAISTLVNTFPGSDILRALFLDAGFFPGL